MLPLEGMIKGGQEGIRVKIRVITSGKGKSRSCMGILPLFMVVVVDCQSKTGGGDTRV